MSGYICGVYLRPALFLTASPSLLRIAGLLRAPGERRSPLNPNQGLLSQKSNNSNSPGPEQQQQQHESRFQTRGPDLRQDERLSPLASPGKARSLPPSFTCPCPCPRRRLPHCCFRTPTAPLHLETDVGRPLCRCLSRFFSPRQRSLEAALASFLGSSFCSSHPAGQSSLVEGACLYWWK